MGSSSNVECDKLSESQLNEHTELIYKLFQFKVYKLRGSSGEIRCHFCGFGEDENDCQYTTLLQHAIREADQGSASGMERAKHLAMAKYLAIDLADDVKGEAEQLSCSKDAQTERKRPRLDENTMEVEMVAVDNVRRLERELDETRDQMNDLIRKERLSNYELQGARRELIKGLDDILRGNHVQIGIKNIGEIDSKVFISEIKKRFSPAYAVMKGVESCSSWQEKLKNPQWYPFQIFEDDNGKPQRLLNEDDSSLQDLKKEWGQEVHDAVVKALTELHEYNPSGCYVIPELWNFKEDRKAKLDEVINYVVEVVKDPCKMGSTSDFNNSRSKGHREMGDKIKMGSTSAINNSDEASDIIDSEIYELKERIYKQLKSCTYKVWDENGRLRCPFCFDDGEQEYGYNYLLQHARTVAENTSKIAEQRANHFALAKYFEIDLPAEFAIIQDVQHERREQMEEELKELSELNNDLESVKEELIAKEKRVLEELVKGLNEWQNGNNFTIGIKRMGEIDVNAFKRGCRKRFPQRESEIIAEALCSMWQQQLRNRHWYPFRFSGDDLESTQINDDDESLRGLEQEWGVEIYNAVVTALKELQVFNAVPEIWNFNENSKVVPEIWNFNENRKAETEEAISYVFTQVMAQKGKITRKSAAILK